MIRRRLHLRERSRALLAALRDDDLMSQAAAIAFYSILSFSPLLLLALWASRGLGLADWNALLGSLERLLGPRVAEAIHLIADRPQQGSVDATLAGLATIALTLFSATGVFAQLQAALNRIWRSQCVRMGWFAWLKKRLLSMGAVLSLGFLLVVSLVASSVLAAVLGREALVWVVVEKALSFALYTGFFLMIYVWLPDTRLSWRDGLVGALVTAALFTLGKSAIDFYLATDDQADAWGPAASLVVLLLWVYYAAIVMLFGAIVTKVWVIDPHAARDAAASERAKASEPERSEPPSAQASPAALTPSEARS